MSRRIQESSPTETKSEWPQVPGQKKTVEVQLTGERLKEANSKVALNVMGRFVASRL